MRKTSIEPMHRAVGRCQQVDARRRRRDQPLEVGLVEAMDVLERVERP